MKKWKLKIQKMKTQNSKIEISKIENTKFKNRKHKIQKSKTQNSNFKSDMCELRVSCVSCVMCVVCVTCVVCVCSMCVSCSTMTLDPLAADDNDSNDCKWSTPQSLLLHVVSERDDTDDGDPMTTTISYRSHSLHWPHRESLTQALPQSFWQVTSEMCTERELLNPQWICQTNQAPSYVWETCWKKQKRGLCQ